MNAYFAKHQYGNTIGRDLWNALGAASGRDVASFMDSWLEQPGYPVLTATVENDTLKLSQKQFFIGEHEDKKRTWVLPLNSNWKGLPETLETETLEIPNYSALAAQNEGALRFNTENTAHYITDYQGVLLEQILDTITDLDSTSKLQVVQERRLLAEAGSISFADLVPVIEKLTEETSYLVVSGVKAVLNGLKLFVDEGSECEKAYNELVVKLIKFNFDRLGFEAKEGESDEDELVRQIVVGGLIAADDQTASQEASRIFAAHQENLEKLPAAIRLHILINQIKHYESKELADQYLNDYVSTVDGSFKRQLASALAYTKDAETLARILESLKNKDIVKPQDLAMSWYFPLLNHQFTQATAWTWARENWDWIKAALGGDMSFDKFVIYPANAFKTAERLAEYRAFFEPQLDDMAISRNISMGIKEIAARVDLIAREKAAVENAIKASV